MELLLVAGVVTWVVGCSGFSDTVLAVASRFTARHGYPPVRSLPPFTCSLCATWWACLIYALCVGAFSLPVVAWCAALAGFSKTMTKIFIFIFDIPAMLIGRDLDRRL